MNIWDVPLLDHYVFFFHFFFFFNQLSALGWQTWSLAYIIGLIHLQDKFGVKCGLDYESVTFMTLKNMDVVV